MAAMTLEEWVDDLQAHGQYTFLRSDAIRGSGLSAEAAKKALRRLVRRRRVANVKDYFFVVVPLEYRIAGAPPPPWFIHDLMVAMRLPYYVGLLSAAALHGAAHQAPQEFQVVTSRSVRPLIVGHARLRFFASKYVVDAAMVELKTPTGLMRVSAPETTVVDLVRFARACGYLDHVAAVIEALLPLLDARRLLAAARRVNDVPAAQRVGHILDRLGPQSLSEPLHKWVRRQGAHSIPLRSGQPVATAPEDRRWRVLVNERLEVGV